MNALFLDGPDLDTRSRDGLHHRLLARKRVRVLEDDGSLTEYLMEVDHDPDDSDGATMPWVARVLNLNPYGVYWPPAFFHDMAFRRKIQQLVGLDWVPVVLSEDRANRIMDALMFSVGTPEWLRILIFETLQKLGWKAYEEDANQYGKSGNREIGKAETI